MSFCLSCFWNFGMPQFKYNIGMYVIMQWKMKELCLLTWSSKPSLAPHHKPCHVFCAVESSRHVYDMSCCVVSVLLTKGVSMKCNVSLIYWQDEWAFPFHMVQQTLASHSRPPVSGPWASCLSCLPSRLTTPLLWWYNLCQMAIISCWLLLFRLCKDSELSERVRPQGSAACVSYVIGVLKLEKKLGYCDWTSADWSSAPNGFFCVTKNKKG